MKTNISKFPKNSQEIINNLRLYAVNKLLNFDSIQSNKILQSFPFIYVLFRNYLTATFDGKKNYLNDNLVLGQNYGKNYLKIIGEITNINSSNLNSIVHENFYDFNDIKEPCFSLSYATGLALNQLLINKSFVKDTFINKTYCILGQEELSSSNFVEILNFANRHEVKDLICLVDFSWLDQNGFITNHTVVDYEKLIKSYNWEYLVVNDGSNLKEIDNNLKKAQKSYKPVFIAIHNIAGYGSSTASTIANINFQINSEELNEIKERFEFNKPIDQVFETTKQDLVKSINDRIHLRKKYYDSLIKNNKNVQDFFNIEKSAKQKNIFKKNELIITSLLKENNLNLVFLLNTNIKVDMNLINNNNFFVCNGSENVIENIIAGLQTASFFNPFLITDLNYINKFNQVILKHKKQICPIYIIDDLINLSNITLDLNNLELNDINCHFIYDIFSSNKWWNESNGINTIYFVDNMFNTLEVWENSLYSLNENINLNILTLGINPILLDKVIFILKNKNIKFNLINILGTKKLNEKLQLNIDVPLILINIEPFLWINNCLIDIKNKKHLVKFNEQEFEKLCLELKY